MAPQTSRHGPPPPRTTTIDIETLLAAPADAPTDTPPPPQRGLLADFSLGAAKGTGNQVLDIARVVSRSPLNPMNLLPVNMLPDAVNPLARLPGVIRMGLQPGYLPPKIEQEARAKLTPENTTQRIGSFAPDVGMAAVTVGPTVARGVRAGARMLERQAVPGLTDEAADLLLRNTSGRVSAGNAARAAQAAQPTTLPSGVLVTPNAAMQNAAQSMQAAAARPGNPLWQDFLAGSAGGYFGGKTGAALVTALRVLNRPGVKSGLAQGAYRTAPVSGATGAGLGINAARGQLSDAELRREAILQQLLGGGGDQR